MQAGVRSRSRPPRTGPAEPGERPSPLAGAEGRRRRAERSYTVAGAFLAAGLLLPLLGVWALFALTGGVTAGRAVGFDERGLLWMNSRGTPLLDRMALEVTALGEGLVVGAIALVAGTLLWLMGQRLYAALLAAAVGGAWAIYPVLKLLFDRPRPQLWEWPAHLATSSSFPSGHATLSMALLAALAYIIHRLSRRRTGIAALLLGGAAVLLVGLSRIYLGVHYPSDVIAGYVVGSCWAACCALAVESLRVRSHSPAWTPPRHARQDAAPRSS